MLIMTTNFSNRNFVLLLPYGPLIQELLPYTFLWTKEHKPHRPKSSVSLSILKKKRFNTPGKNNATMTLENERFFFTHQNVVVCIDTQWSIWYKKNIYNTNRAACSCSNWKWLSCWVKHNKIDRQKNFVLLVFGVVYTGTT